MSGGHFAQSNILMLSIVRTEVRNFSDNIADPFQTRNLIDAPELTELREQFRTMLRAAQRNG